MNVRAAVMLIPLALAAQVEYKGRLERELTPIEAAHQVSEFRLVPDSGNRLPGSQPQDRVFAGDVWGLTAFAVDRAGETFLYVDLNADGQITANEKHVLAPSPDRLHSGIATVHLPLAGPVYRYYPVLVYVYKPQKPETRIVGESPFAFVRGTVEINGRPTLVQYQFDRAKNGAFSDHGWQGMDSDGDGKIDRKPGSPEYTHAEDEVVVFRAGNAYVSTKGLDLVKGEVTLRSHGSGDYRRIELKPGTIFPDLGFKDFSGRARTLSEFRPRYLLLDFWATWCSPCVADLGYLREARDQMRDRGFEIIGMNVDEEPASVPKMLTEKRIEWPQATFASIRDLVEKQARVASYPTYVLLDADRRIIATGEDLRGKQLIPTLQRLLPSRR